MGFLGSLGIDIKLLIAQIVNFAVLLLILRKFLYKPIVDRIEKDEIELKQARIEKEKLSNERKEFELRKKEEIAKVREKASQIIKEADEIASKIKKQSQEKAKEEVAKMLKRAEEKIESQKPEMQKKIIKATRAKIEDNLSKVFSRSFSLKRKKAFNDIFFDDLLEQVENTEISFNSLGTEKTLKREIGSIVSGYSFPISEKQEKRLTDLVAKKVGLPMKVLKRENRKLIGGFKLEEILKREIGSVVLEYAFPISEKQEKRLTDLVAKKVGLPIKILKRENRKLIGGFKFEIAGEIIESNLLKIVHEASKI